MPVTKKYLIDTNVFIQAKNLYYRFDFCGGFWDWVSAAHGAGVVYSIKKVRAELVNGDPGDPAKLWAESLPDSFFLEDENSAGVMASYGKVIGWSVASNHYTPAAKAEFAKATSADAFLIAAARHYGYDIVSQEESQPARKSRIMIPDAANALGVNSIFVYEMLSERARSTFQLKP